MMVLRKIILIFFALTFLFIVSCKQESITSSNTKIYYNDIDSRYLDVIPLKNENEEIILVRKVKFGEELKNKDLYIFNKEDSLIEKYILFNYYNNTPVFSMDFDSCSFVSSINGVPLIIGYDSLQSDSFNLYFDVLQMKNVWTTNLSLSVIKDGNPIRIFREEMVSMPLLLGYKKNIKDSMFLLESQITGRNSNKSTKIYFNLNKLINSRLKSTDGYEIDILKGRRDRGYQINLK